MMNKAIETRMNVLANYLDEAMNRRDSLDMAIAKARAELDGIKFATRSLSEDKGEKS